MNGYFNLKGVHLLSTLNDFMLLHLKYNFNTITTLHLEHLLKQNKLSYKIPEFNEIELLNTLSDLEFNEFKEKLKKNGIEIIENQKVILVQKIKNCIREIIHNSDSISVKTSVYLSDQLGQSYSSLSTIFSEVTYTSIENYIIIQKIEAVKQLIIKNPLTLTEIAFKFNYSSVAHLSTQFKNTTGITPSAFQRIIRKRSERTNQNES